MQILSMMILYPILRKFASNVKIFYICLSSAIIGYAVLFMIAFVNMSNVFILFVPGFFIFAANGVLQVLTTVFLANTVDYGELKNGRRDEDPHAKPGEPVPARIASPERLEKRPN